MRQSGVRDRRASGEQQVFEVHPTCDAFHPGVSHRCAQEVRATKFVKPIEFCKPLQAPIRHAGVETHVLQIRELLGMFQDRGDGAIGPRVDERDLIERVGADAPDEPTEPA